MVWSLSRPARLVHFHNGAHLQMVETKCRERHQGNARSPSKISGNIGVLVKCDSSCAIVTVVWANRGEIVRCGICKILVFDTLINWSVLEFKRQEGQCMVVGLSQAHSHPSIPPLPLARNRPFQFSGSHISKDILDLLEGGMESPTRHRSTGTTWLDRLHVGSFSGKVRFVPAATYSRTVRLLLKKCVSGARDKHLARRLQCAWTAVSTRAKESVINARRFELWAMCFQSQTWISSGFQIKGAASAIYTYLSPEHVLRERAAKDWLRRDWCSVSTESCLPRRGDENKVSANAKIFPSILQIIIVSSDDELCDTLIMPSKPAEFSPSEPIKFAFAIRPFLSLYCSSRQIFAVFTRELDQARQLKAWKLTRIAQKWVRSAIVWAVLWSDWATFSPIRTKNYLQCEHIVFVGVRNPLQYNY